MPALRALADRWRIAPCEICRRIGHGGLCAGCVARHARPTTRCTACALPVAADAPHCAACLRQPPPQTRSLAAVDYDFPWDGLIGAFKYHGRAELAPMLAALLFAALPADEAPWPQLIVPMPLAPRRLAERGYNQAWELARRVARRCTCPAEPDVLRRPVDAPPQAGRGRDERRRGLRGAFWVARPERVCALRIALVDDVITTGATAAAASAALLAAGASQVHVWALARTA